MLSFFRALDLEFEPRFVGTAVLPLITYSRVCSNSILRPVPGRYPPESLGEYAENTESWVPTLGNLLQLALGRAEICICKNSPGD